MIKERSTEDERSFILTLDGDTYRVRRKIGFHALID
ncbi:hypothetical protein SAMN05421852_101275 [Thermoflavimicrobium dichotomicum]|uniref:Uncharacterized protein n=1 Tax=Thermoflavimicrobium dichotomicum TaxID=46223 RepID=A0A1I3K040_9BACL|nr:hypothetical protein SAMN05421852_101275 [Thermoflavimicrobium dichotomicum]